MADEEVSYETVQDMLRQERRSNRIVPVTDAFWHRLQEFLKDVEGEFREAQAKDPFDRRSMMLRDRVMNARHAAESVWALRERKLAMLALAHARDGKRPDGLTKVEVDLYDRLLRTLQEGRELVFGGAIPAEPPKLKTVQQPRAPAPEPTAPPVPAATVAPTPAAPEPEAAPPEPVSPSPSEPESEPDAPAPEDETDERPIVTVPADTPDEETATIRAIGEIPPFVGPDMQTYRLADGDLAMVPQGIADLLIKRGKAAVVEA